MDDPIAYFLTISAYGSWLPGDSRGWIDYRQGWKLPSSVLEWESQTRMSEDACRLDASQRSIVERQVVETCRHRGWFLHAVNCRSNHLHAVITAANTAASKVRGDLKAWCTRRLKELSDPARANWWAERGSVRWIFDEQSLETVIRYLSEAQDRKQRDRS